MDRETNEKGKVTDLDSFLEDLEKMITDYIRSFSSHERDISRQHTTYDNIIKSKWNSKELKAIASLGKVVNFEDQARLASNISILYTIQRLVLNLKILENKIDNLIEQLGESRIIEKAKDIDDIKELKRLLAEQYKKREKQQKQMEEAHKRAEESRKKHLPYVG